MHSSRDLPLVETLPDSIRYLPEGDHQAWNRIQWWNWEVDRVLEEKGVFSLGESKQKRKSLIELFDYVKKTKLFIGTKVKYTHPITNEVLIGFIEKPMIHGDEMVTNIERTQFLGQNSWNNYLIKYVELEDLEVISYLPENTLDRLNTYLIRNQVPSKLAS